MTDPLSEVTRKERKALLGISLAAIVLVKVGLVPTRIVAFGIEFGQADQRALLVILGFVVAYFLITFGIYALADYLSWKHTLIGTIEEWNDYRSAGMQPSSFTSTMVNASLVRFVRTPPVSATRNFLDLVFPILVGLYAIVVTWTAPAQKPTISDTVPHVSAPAAPSTQP